MVRITVNTSAAARKVPEIRARLNDEGIAAPLIGDFHYNGHKLLAENAACADALAKFRINPGNVGRGEKRDPQFAAIIRIANEREKPVRIGVNWGSLDQELLVRFMDENARQKTPLPSEKVLQNALVESALSSARAAESLGMPPARIVISCKTSRMPDLLAVYRRLGGENAIIRCISVSPKREWEFVGRRQHRRRCRFAGRRNRRYDSCIADSAAGRGTKRRSAIVCGICCRRWDCGRFRRKYRRVRDADGQAARHFVNWRRQ